MEHIYVTLENLSRFLNNLKSTIVNKNDIANDLTTGDATKVLSAEQGVTLKAQIDELETALETVHVQADWSQTDETAPDYIKNKPDEADALELIAETGLVEPMTDENGSILTDENGAIYTLI